MVLVKVSINIRNRLTDSFQTNVTEPFRYVIRSEEINKNNFFKVKK